MQRLLLALAAAAFAVLAGGPVLAQGTLRIAVPSNANTLDPAKTKIGEEYIINFLVFSGLTEIDASGKVKPDLAESWSASEDQKTWTFKLRPGVRFHHGKILDAGDVKATLERILDPATRSPKRNDFGAVRAVEAVDPLTVRIALGERFAPFLATLGQGWGAILPADLIARRQNFATQPVGTGPFTVAEWQRDSFIRLQRFDGYWRKGEPRLREVMIRFVPERAVKVAGLLSGEFDAVDGVDPLDLPRVRANPNVKIIRQVTSLINVVAINNSRPALRDVRVRRALWYAIDRRQVLKTAYGDESVVSNVFMDVVSPFYVDIPDPYPYNPDQAKKLLAEAGHASGLTLDLALPQPYQAHIDAGQLVQGMLAKAGVTARPRVVEWGFWLSRVYGGGDYDLTIIGHTGKLDPDGRLAGFGDPARNYVKYANQKVEDLILAGRITTTPDLRKRIYTEALKMMTDEAMLIPLGTPVLYFATHRSVQGFRQLYAIDTYDFRKTTK